MRKTIVIFWAIVILLVFFQATGVFAAAAVVQTASTSPATAATSGALAFPSNLTAGNFAILCENDNNGATSTISSITETGSNTWNKVVADSEGGFVDGEMWYAKNLIGGADTVTVNLKSSATFGFTIREYSGLDTVSPFVASGTRSTRGITIGQATTSNSIAGNMLAIGCGQINDSTLKITVPAQDGFGNKAIMFNTTAGTQGVMADLATTTGTGKQQFTETQSSADHTVTQVALFQLASAAATPPTVAINGQVSINGKVSI